VEAAMIHVDSRDSRWWRRWTGWTCTVSNVNPYGHYK